MGEVWVESICPKRSLTQRAVGEDLPDMRPAARLRAAKVPVSSMMCWLIGEPRAIWFGVMIHL